MSEERLTAVIVDDEELARQYLRELLGAHPEIEVTAECANGFEAVKAIGEQQPDLLFLDIQMPKIDGFEVLELIPDGITVVFVTAYDEYALRAFEVHAADYLLKPFSAARFEEALEQVRRRRTSGGGPSVRQVAAEARPAKDYLRRIAVKDGGTVHVFPVDNLDYVEAQEDYVALKTGGRTYLKQQTISNFEKSLNPARFVRIHRSYIVNLDRVSKIEPYTKDSKVAVLSGGEQLPVSRSGQSKLKAIFGG
jgi:two-component system, LytTR family, response regulator